MRYETQHQTSENEYTNIILFRRNVNLDFSLVPLNSSKLIMILQSNKLVTFPKPSISWPWTYRV